MEIDERMAKAETQIEALKEALRSLQVAMERGFAEQRAVMERGFAEERAARERAFRWTFSVMLSVLALVLGIIAKLAGAF